MSSFFLNLFKELNLMKLMQSLSSYNSTQKTYEPQNAGLRTEKRPFSEIIKEASQIYGIDESIITAVIKQESAFNPSAVSSCGAMGLMQLMPSTAKSLGVINAFNAEENIMAGTKYLKEKLDEFNGSLPLALAAYNAGSGAVKKYAGIPPYEETQAYVNKVIKSIDYWA